jgi:hypothetical protein
MLYLYVKTIIPNLDSLEGRIYASSIYGTYNYFRWDDDDDKLKVYLNRELNIEEKILLDIIVSDI